MTGRPVDAMEVVVLVDNTTDGLSSTRPGAVSEMQALLQTGRPAGSASCLCSAAHGLSLLLTTWADGTKRTMLFDTGPEASVFDRNVARLGIDLGEIDEIFLSHGHWDHCGATLVALDRIAARSGRPRTPVHAHPGMFRSRGLRLPTGQISWMDNVPTAAELEDHGAVVVDSVDPHAALDGTVHSSGDIPRVTPYERGMPGQVARTPTGSVEPDEQLDDERWAAVLVRDVGVVVLTACTHAGIGNVLAHAVGTFPGAPLHAVIGGLHLSGPNERVILPSIDAIVGSGVSLVAPGHCTGWRATAELARRMSDNVQPLAVGMRLRFGAEKP